MDLYNRIIAHRDDIERLAREHKARNVRVFGSVARGDADEASDLDLLGDVEPDATLLDLGALLMELQELLGCRVDMVTEDGLRERIRKAVIKGAIPLQELAAQV
jgi:uncharacterized protein